MGIRRCTSATADLYQNKSRNLEYCEPRPQFHAEFRILASPNQWRGDSCLSQFGVKTDLDLLTDLYADLVCLPPRATSEDSSTMAFELRVCGSQKESLLAGMRFEQPYPLLCGRFLYHLHHHLVAHYEQLAPNEGERSTCTSGHPSRVACLQCGSITSCGQSLVTNVF